MSIATKVRPEFLEFSGLLPLTSHLILPSHRRFGSSATVKYDEDTLEFKLKIVSFVFLINFQYTFPLLRPPVCQSIDPFYLQFLFLTDTVLTFSNR